jgi:hypothetical protein
MLVIPFFADKGGTLTLDVYPDDLIPNPNFNWGVFGEVENPQGSGLGVK